ncbi:SAICAR synthetase [Jaminaea rosea]|uniref:Phosphoribosylaminoimidazole-succinocarboxamide synthase n=1 Tax=Jaminaea rosea TaxID=1569628 RepID=A0A316URK4_9BASI|nr:SAICAR synthetase [Jaminaea rosea]PWN27408.1 SAICAR synthetase [Jaminaea rosea]
MNSAPVVTTTDLPLKLIARGKVRDVYDAEIAEGDEHAGALLFVASDRISAFDVILENGIPEKGHLLHALSTFWFDLLTPSILPSHVLATSFDAFPASLRNKLAAHRAELDGRSMLVRRAQVLPIEAIVRGHITGSGWKEYKKSGTVHGLKLPAGMQESQEIPDGPIFTPSTKADQGEHDENIHPDQAKDILGPELAKAVSEAAVALYSKAAKHAASRGIILADTKFEFGLVPATAELPATPGLAGGKLPTSSGGQSLDGMTLILVDEVLTPDSSRFWSKDSFAVGKGQASFDKQYVRDWLIEQGLDRVAYDESQKGTKITLPDDVARKTSEKYRECYEKITGKAWRQ